MKIIDKTKDVKNVIEVIKTEYVGEYRLRLCFNDGKKRTVSFKEFLLHSQHPDIKKYLDEKNFKRFKIDYGNLNWNDYEMCFPIYDLYRGKISQKSYS